jgi:hypothetical protein
MGGIVTWIAFRRNLPWSFGYGLAAPTISVVCFSTICGLDWSPEEAQVPISLLLVTFSLGCLPLAVIALDEVRRRPKSAAKLPFQFGIATMLWGMALISVPLGASRAGGQVGAAVSVLGAYLVALAVLLRKFSMSRVSATVPTLTASNESSNGNKANPNCDPNSERLTS